MTATALQLYCYCIFEISDTTAQLLHNLWLQLHCNCTNIASYSNLHIPTALLLQIYDCNSTATAYYFNFYAVRALLPHGVGLQLHCNCTATATAYLKFHTATALLLHSIWRQLY